MVGWWWWFTLDFSLSSGPFLSYEIEIGDGPGPEIDNFRRRSTTSRPIVSRQSTSVSVKNCWWMWMWCGIGVSVRGILFHVIL